jgi:hypothetical protein
MDPKIETRSNVSALRTASSSADPLEAVRDALATMKFGAIQLTVHEGRLVQMDITEKRRFL